MLAFKYLFKTNSPDINFKISKDFKILSELICNMINLY